MKLFSIVKPDVKKSFLIRGMILGFCGTALLLGMGVFASVDILSVWGIPSFLGGIFLIGFGLIPYRKLTRLETHPHQIILDENAFTFISTYGNEVRVLYSTIKKITFVETKRRYGLRLELEGKSPLFLPHFLDNSCLNEIVHPDQTDESF